MSRLDGTLMAFAIFALAFVVCPVGKSHFMAVQRRWGQGTKLTLALFLLGGTTMVWRSVCPAMPAGGQHGHRGAGHLAHWPGLALGGTWDGLPSLLAMSAPQKEQRSWFHDPGSWARRWGLCWLPACLPTCTAA